MCQTLIGFQCKKDIGVSPTALTDSHIKTIDSKCHNKTLRPSRSSPITQNHPWGWRKSAVRRSSLSPRVQTPAISPGRRAAVTLVPAYSGPHMNHRVTPHYIVSHAPSINMHDRWHQAVIYDLRSCCTMDVPYLMNAKMFYFINNNHTIKSLNCSLTNVCRYS